MRCITYVCIWMSPCYISWADVAGSLYLSSYDTENGDSDVGKEKKTWTHIGEENVVIELDMGNIWWWWWWCIGKRKRQRWEEGVEEPALELWDNRGRIGMVEAVKMRRWGGALLGFKKCRFFFFGGLWGAVVTGCVVWDVPEHWNSPSFLISQCSPLSRFDYKTFLLVGAVDCWGSPLILQCLNTNCLGAFVSVRPV